MGTKNVKTVKPKEEAPEIFGVDSLEDLSDCGSCGAIFSGEACPVCAKVTASPVQEVIKEKGAVDQDGLVTCGKCGTVFDWKLKGVDKPGFFEGIFDGEPPGVSCPSCESPVLGADGKPLKKDNPGDEDADFSPWDSLDED